MFPFSLRAWESSAPESILKMGLRSWCDEAVSGGGSQSNLALSSRVSSCMESSDSHLVLSLFEMLCDKKKKKSFKPPGLCVNRVPFVVFKVFGAEHVAQ